jgi:branched-chain amino acid transport system permease protein
VYGTPFLGLTFGPQIQVYYLIAVYCFVCTAAMYAFTGTPLGRILNAVRDNPERVEFIGYNTQRVRYFAFIIAGFFAGIGGGLAAINFEIVNAADSLNGIRSGGYLLFTFLGGATFFFGPIIGAVLLVFASILLSEMSKAWLLYLGLVFLFMVMYAPGGVASLIMMNLRVARFGKLKPFWVSLCLALATGRCGILGIAAIVEMIYHIQLNAALGRSCPSSAPLDTQRVDSWAGAIFVVRSPASACSRWCGAASCSNGAIAGRDRARDQAPGGMSAQDRSALGPGTEGPAQEFRQDRHHPRRGPAGERRASASPSSGRTARASRRCST